MITSQMSLQDAKTADAIIKHRVTVYGDTVHQLKLFGADATATELANVLGCSVTTARKRAESCVRAGVADKLYHCSRRRKISYGVQLPVNVSALDEA